MIVVAPVQFPDYRSLLRQELARRAERNKGYSLRAFARDLGISIAPLSRLLAGKQHLSIQSFRSVVDALFFDNKEEYEYFTALYEYATARSARQRELAVRRLRVMGRASEQTQLELETLTAIEEWHHVAIMEYICLDDADQRPESIAKALDVSLPQVQVALERLTNLKLITIGPDGRLEKTNKRLIAPTVPNASLRKFNRQMIEKSLQSFENQSFDERYLSAQTLSLSKKDVGQLKKMIQSFFESVARTRSPDNHDAIYQLNIQLFNLAPTYTSKGSS